MISDTLQVPDLQHDITDRHRSSTTNGGLTHTCPANVGSQCEQNIPGIDSTHQHVVLQTQGTGMYGLPCDQLSAQATYT